MSFFSKSKSERTLTTKAKDGVDTVESNTVAHQRKEEAKEKEKELTLEERKQQRKYVGNSETKF
jgi:hypothetical protein